MATCRTNQPKPIVPSKKYILTLNEREAAILRFLLGQTCGTCQPKTASSIASDIYNTLCTAQVPIVIFDDSEYRKPFFKFPENGKDTFTTEQERFPY